MLTSFFAKDDLDFWISFTFFFKTQIDCSKLHSDWSSKLNYIGRV